MNRGDAPGEDRGLTAKLQDELGGVALKYQGRLTQNTIGLVLLIGAIDYLSGAKDDLTAESFGRAAASTFKERMEVLRERGQR